VCLSRGKYSQARLSSARIKLTKQIYLLILSDSIIEVNQPRRSTRLQEKKAAAGIIPRQAERKDRFITKSLSRKALFIL
jgi:hypothetical protein